MLLRTLKIVTESYLGGQEQPLVFQGRMGNQMLFFKFRALILSIKDGNSAVRRKTTTACSKEQVHYCVRGE